MVPWPTWCIQASAFYEHNKKSPGGAVTALTYDSSSPMTGTLSAQSIFAFSANTAVRIDLLSAPIHPSNFPPPASLPRLRYPPTLTRLPGPGAADRVRVLMR